MKEELNTVLKEKRIYKVYFDSVVPSSKDSDDNYYNEIVYYDGGGVEGHGDSEEN